MTGKASSMYKDHFGHNIMIVISKGNNRTLTKRILKMLSKKELEDLRPWVADNVTKVLGFSESTVVSAALDCIGRNLSRQATTDQLVPFLDKEAPQFVATLYKKVLELKTAKLMSTNFTASSVPKKRNIDDVFGDDEERSDTRSTTAAKPPEAKKKRVSRFNTTQNGEPGDPQAPPTHDIQHLLDSTKRQIEERKRQTQSLLAQATSSTLASPIFEGSLLPTPVNIPVLPAAMQAMLASGRSLESEAFDKARKAAELQARIQSQLLNKAGLFNSLPGGMEKPQVSSKPTPLILDQEGRTVDNLGRTIQLSVRQPTLKANIRAQQRATFRQITDKKPGNKEEEKEEGSFVDTRVHQSIAGRGRKLLKFNEPGKFVKQAQMLRAKSQLERLQSQITSVARKTGISSATKLALIAPTNDQSDNSVPDMEWWDSAILANKSYNEPTPPPLYQKDRYESITNLIEHPVEVEPPAEPAKPAALPIILTSKERKKLRKQRRREAEKEKQEKIQFGLIDKPEPKVRISNLMRVLGSEAVQDPTKVEAHVRAQMAERQKNHEEANAARKLTPDQRRAKKLQKMKEDLSCGVHVTVYRVHDLSNPAIKFKVDMNAQQYHLTGCVLLYHDVNLVIVEGGPKALKKFKRLMLNRIKWKTRDRRGGRDDDDDSDNEGGHRVHNMCTVVWEGVVNDRAFTDWKIRHFPTEPLARDHLKRRSIEHYWDLALSQRIVEQEEN